MKDFGAGALKDVALLAARILLVVLFLIFGWDKLANFSGTEAYFTKLGAPMPGLATVIAVIMELPVGIALILGILTRPIAVALALYTLGTALIGHAYWSMSGEAQYLNEINFYKNISIRAG
jgi:putative oxidoreductase